MVRCCSLPSISHVPLFTATGPENCALHILYGSPSCQFGEPIFTENCSIVDGLVATRTPTMPTENGLHSATVELIARIGLHRPKSLLSNCRLQG